MRASVARQKKMADLGEALLDCVRYDEIDEGICEYIIIIPTQWLHRLIYGITALMRPSDRLSVQ